MRFLSLTDISAISGPERERLGAADEAIRDILAVTSAHPSGEPLDAELVGAGLINLLLLAAAQLALADRTPPQRAGLVEDFTALAGQALDWAAAERGKRRALNPGQRPRREP